MNDKYPFIPLQFDYTASDEQLFDKSKAYADLMKTRRTVRNFSSREIPAEVLENILTTAGSAPSGANMQPWFFAAVTDPEIKSAIRREAEKQEREFYNSKAPDEWLNDLAPLGTGDSKPFLEKAPCLIVIFEKKYGFAESGEKKKFYYTKESVGLAAGFLVSALHNAGLACLTYTPSPMGFLNKILGRPDNEKPWMVIVTGFPEENTNVPDIKKKTLNDIAKFY